MPAYTSKTPLSIIRTQPTNKVLPLLLKPHQKTCGESKTKTRAKYSEDYKHLGKKIESWRVLRQLPHLEQVPKTELDKTLQHFFLPNFVAKTRIVY